MEKDNIPLIIPAGTEWNTAELKCPVCKELAVRHKSHWRVRSGRTDGWLCAECYRTWKAE